VLRRHTRTPPRGDCHGTRAQPVCACAWAAHRCTAGAPAHSPGAPRRWRAEGGGGAQGGYSRVLPRYRAAEVSRRVVPSCAGAYVAGASGSNECPVGSVWIETEAACRTAVTATGKTASSYFARTNSTEPRGCYYYTGGNGSIAFFSNQSVGAGRSVAQPLCAVTIGAPPAVNADARFCAVVHGAGGVYNENTNGLNIKPHAYIHVQSGRRAPAVSRGARQRRRTADGRADARHERVFKHGYSRGTTGVLCGARASVGMGSTRFGCGRVTAAQRSAAVRGCGRGTTSQGDRRVLTGYSV
jgi:hypothetical protein